MLQTCRDVCRARGLHDSTAGAEPSARRGSAPGPLEGPHTATHESRASNASIVPAAAAASASISAATPPPGPGRHGGAEQSDRPRQPSGVNEGDQDQRVPAGCSSFSILAWPSWARRSRA